MNTREKGRQSESFAVDYLKKNNFKICGVNYYTRYGEIDIISEKDNYIIFFEVRSRKINAMVSPAASVDTRKQQKIIKTAYMYLVENNITLQPRFDVIEILLKDKGFEIERINHIENAFGQEGEYAVF